MSDNGLIGTNHVPKDLLAKITGRAKYAEDFRADGMVFAKLLLSPVPRGRVRNLDVRAALDMEGVLGVLTPDDVPSISGATEPILTSEPLYQGQPIAAVAAVDETTAAEAVERLRLDIQRLPFALDPVESLRPGGPDGRDGGNVMKDGEVDTLKWSSAEISRFEGDTFPEDLPVTDEWSVGDLEAAFAASDLVIEEAMVYQSQTHHPLESRSAMAYWRNGRVFIHCSTQSVSQTRRAFAGHLDMDEEDVVVISEFCGGAFGSKIRGSLSDMIPALLSQKVGRPVMLRVTRDEETAFGRARPGLQGWIKIGFRSDGKVLALDSLVIQDNGPFGRSGDMVMFGNVLSLAYQPEAMRHRATSVFTNTPPRSAQRAPGGLQGSAMVEPLLDRAARELGVDRMAMMKLNAPQGRARFGPNQNELTSAFVHEAVDRAVELFDWNEKKEWNGRANGSKVTGVGVGYAPFVGGSSGFDGLMVIRPDGKLYIHQGIGNLGTHSMLDTARAANDVLEHSWDDTEVVWGDTGKGLPWSSTQSGSQTTHAHTRANHAAAHALREKLQEIAADELGGSAGDYEVAQGRVYRRGSPSTGLTFAQAAERAISLGGRYSGEELPDDLDPMTVHAVRRMVGEGLISAVKDPYSHDGATWSSVITCCVVEVDQETGVVEMKEIVSVTDCGTVLNPRSLEAQVHGGVIQGMSSALLERWAFDPRWGANSNKRFYTAKPITILDVPSRPFEFAALDLADPETPVGARGIGEPPVGAGAAALISAITGALGGRYLNRTPITPDKIVSLLEGSRTGYGRMQTHV
jgi:CO/xanthine dehydrogenase Mo-binding subunit